MLFLFFCLYFCFFVLFCFCFFVYMGFPQFCDLSAQNYNYEKTVNLVQGIETDQCLLPTCGSKLCSNALPHCWIR